MEEDGSVNFRHFLNFNLLLGESEELRIEQILIRGCG